MTAEKRDGAGRRIADARFRTYFELGLVGMVASAPDGVFLEVNDRFCELLGYTQSELAGRTLHDVTHPEDRAGDMAGLDAVKRGECDRWSVEKRFVGRNDRVIHAIASTAALRRADGAIDHLISIVQDITPQKTAEEELRKRAQVFKAFVESTPDLIARFDRDLRRLYVNPAIEGLTGRPASELIGKTLGELNFDARFTEALEQALREVFATGAETTLEVMLPDRSGERVYQARIVPERGVTGKPEYALVISRDITAIRRDQERLHALTREIELANRLVGLGRVASAMSHEFNNVLMGIQPFAEILLRASTDARVINAARRIIASVRRGRDITESLRAFTRPVPPVRTPLDVRSWLSESSAELERLVSSNVQFRVDIDETPMAIEADRNQMTQVLSSIIVNAREAIGKEKGSIRLTASLTAGDDPEESFVHFSVVDDGPGIEVQNLSRILEPFFTTKESGKGLGLAIAEQIVSLHGGHLLVESKTGNTMVHFFLPAVVKTGDTAVDAGVPVSPRRRWPTDILLVEDDEAVAAGVVALLEEEKVNVRVARDGAEALKILESCKPQALVIDVNLPDCNGFDLYAKITKSAGALPVVFASGHADATRLENVRSSAGVRLLTKPFAIDTLLDALAALAGDGV